MNTPSRASGGRIHVCPRAYVSLHCGGQDADERRYFLTKLQSLYFNMISLFVSNSIYNPSDLYPWLNEMFDDNSILIKELSELFFRHILLR